MPYLRRDVKTCDGDVPTKATFAILDLAVAYNADETKMTKDPLFSEITTLLKEFDDTCACTKFGRKS